MKKIKDKDIKKFLDGDDNVFPEIYEFYQDKIYYLAISILRNPTDGEEVVQNTFIKVIQNRKSLIDYKAFNSWVYRIAYNASLDLYRKNKKYINNDKDYEIDYFVDEQREEIPNSIFSKEIMSEMEDSINSLPKQQREMATLRFIGELSLKEISDIMDLPEGTVKSKLFRIRKTLQSDLSRKNISPIGYMAITFAPMTTRLIDSIVKNYSLSADRTSAIASNITSLTGLTFNAVTSSSHIGLSTIAVVLSGCLVFGGGAYLSGSGIASKGEEAKTLEETKPVFTGYEYDSSITNKDLQIVLSFSNAVDPADVEVKSQDAKLELKTTENNKLSFFVSDNGDYQVSYNGSVETISIKNIDKEYPNIIKMYDNENGQLKVEATDNLSGVDFSNSYFISDNNKISFTDITNSSAILESTINNNGSIVLYDYAGNYSSFNVSVNQ